MDDFNWKIFTCGLQLVFIIIYGVIGEWSVNYLLEFFLSKTIPFLGALVIGLFAGEVSIPVAIVIAVLKYFHVM